MIQLRTDNNGDYLAENECDIIAAQASYHHRRHGEDEVAGHCNLQ